VSNRKDGMHALVAKCEALGWQVKPTRHGWRITAPATAPDKAPPAPVSIGGDGDYRAVRNAAGDLRRIGLDTAWAEHQQRQQEGRRRAIADDRARVAC